VYLFRGFIALTPLFSSKSGLLLHRSKKLDFITGRGRFQPMLFSSLNLSPRRKAHHQAQAAVDDLEAAGIQADARMQRQFSLTSGRGQRMLMQRERGLSAGDLKRKILGVDRC
jgi:hypothetical protein